jgi:hypothetical protein
MNGTNILTDDAPVHPDDELLVAYLDDELPDRQRAEVEKRIISDEPFCARLRALQSGWEMLDELPDETPSEKLVESTIELVVSDIRPAVDPGKLPWWKRHRTSLFAIVVLVASFAIGATAMWFQRRIQIRNELRQLSVAKDLDAYLLEPDFDFFRRLRSNPRWLNLLDAMDKVGMRYNDELPDMETASLSERAELVQSLPTDDRQSLESKWDRYQELNPQSRQRIQQTADEVDQQSDRELLLGTMRAFAVWEEQLDNLDVELKDRIRSDDPEQRRAALEQAIAMTMESLAMRSGALISDETSDRIFFWLEDMLDQRLSDHGGREAIGRWREEMSQRGRRGPFPFQVSDDLVTGLALRRLVDGSDFVPPPLKSIHPLRDHELEEVLLILDDKALQDLEALTNMPTRLMRETAVSYTLRSWAREAIRRNLGDDDTTIVERYEEQRDRDVLDLRPPEEIQQRLQPRRRWFERLRPSSRPDE